MVASHKKSSHCHSTSKQRVARVTMLKHTALEGPSPMGWLLLHAQAQHAKITLTKSSRQEQGLMGYTDRCLQAVYAEHERADSWASKGQGMYWIPCSSPTQNQKAYTTCTCSNLSYQLTSTPNARSGRGTAPLVGGAECASQPSPQAEKSGE